MRAYLILFVISFGIISQAQDFALMPGEQIALTGHEDGLRTIRFSADNTQIIGDNKDLLKWNIQSGNIIQKVAIPGYTTQQSTVNSNQKVWVQGNSNYNDPAKKDITNMHSNLNVYDYDLKKMFSKRIDQFYIKDHVFLPGRSTQMIIMTSDPKTYLYSIKYFTLDGYSVLSTLVETKTDKDLMICMDISEDGKYLAVGYAGSKSRIEIWSLETDSLLKTFPREKEVHKVRISNGIVAGAGEKTISIIDLSRLEETKVLNSTVGCFALALSPNGKTVAVGDRTGAELIDVSSKKITKLFDGQCQSICFDQKGNMVAVGVFKSMHIADIPSAYIFFNKNKNESAETATEIEVEKPAKQWYTYSHDKPGMTVDLPIKPEVKSMVSKSGVKQSQIKSLGSNNGALINIAEAKSVKSKSYYSKSKEIADKFLQNMGDGARIVSKGDFEMNGQKGTEYVFTKGKFKYYYRCILIDKRLFQFTFFTRDASSEDFKKFFDSILIN